MLLIYANQVNSHSTLLATVMPLNLVIKETNTLNLEALVKQQKIHEPKLTVKAICQVNWLALPVSVTGRVVTKDVEPTPVHDAFDETAD